LKGKWLALDRWGDVGVGTSVIFIALTLTASSAASVMLSTASDQQQQAELTANEALTEVATGLTVLEVTGHSSSDCSYIISAEVYLRLAPGSPVVSMDDMTLLVTGANVHEELQFGLEAPSADSYQGALVIGNSDISSNWTTLHVLGPGDMAKLVIGSELNPLHLKSGERAQIDFLLPGGTQSMLWINAPDPMSPGWFTLR